MQWIQGHRAMIHTACNLKFDRLSINSISLARSHQLTMRSPGAHT
jgi:hypothetical protein